jgi:KDO2-lipid IV(A) lauroyltransferase
VTLLFRLLGKLPLSLNHLVGAFLGWTGWLLSSRHRRITRENLARYATFTGLNNLDGLTRAAISAQGQGITELAIAWTAPLSRLQKLVVECKGWEHVEAALAARRAMIFVSPHLGCYDLAGRYLSTRTPITAMYRPPKQAWLEPIMQAGRVRGAGNTVTADAAGVRGLLRTLKHGGSVMILPDQVPAPEQGGDGVWADFFGAPAYTMTLLPRLAKSADALVLYCFAERLPGGSGYRVHIEPMTEPYSADRTVAARQTNAMVERLVGMAPAQYLWGYNRFKQPAGAPMPGKQEKTS